MPKFSFLICSRHYTDFSDSWIKSPFHDTVRFGQLRETLNKMCKLSELKLSCWNLQPTLHALGRVRMYEQTWAICVSKNSNVLLSHKARRRKRVYSQSTPLDKIDTFHKECIRSHSSELFSMGYKHINCGIKSSHTIQTSQYLSASVQKSTHFATGTVYHFLELKSLITLKTSISEQSMNICFPQWTQWNSLESEHFISSAYCSILWPDICCLI